MSGRNEKEQECSCLPNRIEIVFVNCQVAELPFRLIHSALQCGGYRHLFKRKFALWFCGLGSMATLLNGETTYVAVYLVEFFEGSLLDNFAMAC